MTAVVVCGLAMLLVLVICVISMCYSLDRAKESAENLCSEAKKLSMSLAYIEGNLSELRYQIDELTLKLHDVNDDLETLETDE